ncbi:MAG: DUF1189 family protein [Elusimicrobiota bacterium]|jgi:hypothetical protein
MILDPINSITSINFYRRISGQNVGRSLLYIAYLGFFFSLAFTLMLWVRVMPPIQEAFVWLETNVPPITFANNRLSTPTNELVTIRYPKLDTVAFTLDTKRTEPVTPQMMTDGKVLAYVTANSMYLMQNSGKLDVYDFSKTPNAKSVVIDAKLYRELARMLPLVLLPLGFVVCFIVFFIWKIIAALFYSLVALIVNGVSGAGMQYAPLFNISAYAQTLIVAVQGILLFLPVHLPLLRPLSLLATTVYIWLAVRRHSAPADQPA